MDNVYTIRAVVMSYMNRRRYTSMSDYEYLEQLCIEGVRFCRVFSNKAISVRHLTIRNGSVDLPKDYIDYQLIAGYSNGVLYTLGRNDQLLHEEVRLVDDSIEFVSQEEVAQYGGYQFVDHTHGGVEVTGLYANGSGFVQGYYTINENLRKIFISGKLNGTKIVLQYVSHKSACGETFINPLYFETLIAWIDEKVAESKGNRLEVREKRQRFKEEFELADFNHNMPSIQEIHEVVLRGQTRTPK